MISMNSLKVTTQMMNQIYGSVLRTTRDQITRLEAGVQPAFCLQLANIRPCLGDRRGGTPDMSIQRTICFEGEDETRGEIKRSA
ncbi:hypothetical protein SDNOR2018_00279 [Streptococcus dysgalactiae]